MSAPSGNPWLRRVVSAAARGDRSVASADQARVPRSPYWCPVPTPMLLLLNVHPSRRGRPGHARHAHQRSAGEPAPVHGHRYGNCCTRVVAAGPARVTFSRRLRDPRFRPARRLHRPDAVQAPVRGTCPTRTLCLPASAAATGETDRMTAVRPAWRQFGRHGARLGAGLRPSSTTPTSASRSATSTPARPRPRPRRTRSNWASCRDFAHLAITLVPLHEHPGALLHRLPRATSASPISDAPMDFSAWFEVYLGGRWRTFDARHNKPRIGRILMARGRDATDVAITTAFAPGRPGAVRGGHRRVADMG